MAKKSKNKIVYVKATKEGRNTKVETSINKNQPHPLVRPARIEYEPWKTQHQQYLKEAKEAAQNKPVHAGIKNAGRDAGADVLVFREPPDVLPQEEYEAVMAEATKCLGLRTAYSTELPDMLLEHMANGGTQDAFCGKPEVGVSHQTFWKWLKLYPELRVAKEVGVALAQRYWEGIGNDSMFLPDGVRFNMSAWRMIMMNRFSYKDKTTLETAEGDPLAVVPLLQQPHRNLDNLSVVELKLLRGLLAKIEVDEQQPEPLKQLN